MNQSSYPGIKMFLSSVMYHMCFILLEYPLEPSSGPLTFINQASNYTLTWLIPNQLQDSSVRSSPGSYVPHKRLPSASWPLTVSHSPLTPDSFDHFLNASSELISMLEEFSATLDMWLKNKVKADLVWRSLFEGARWGGSRADLDRKRLKLPKEELKSPAGMRDVWGDLLHPYPW